MNVWLSELRLFCRRQNLRSEATRGPRKSPANAKFHINRRVFCIFISLRQFMRRQGRAATRAPRQNFVIFIKQTARIGFFYNRPNFFHIFRVIGRVRMFLVQPKADAFGKFFPFFFVFPNVFPAFLIESGNAKTFNILF